MKKLSRFQKILIPAVILSVVLILGILVPDLVANLSANHWQDKTEKTYNQMVYDPMHHYKLTIKRETTEGKQTRQRECWLWNRNHLYITREEGDALAYELVVNSDIYKKIVTPENPDVPWGPKGSVIDADTTTKTFQERNWVFSRISGTLAGPEVTYVKSGPQNIQVTFRFNWDGTLTGITASLRSERVPYREDVYTFLETDDKEIRDTIKEAFNEATKE